MFLDTVQLRDVTKVVLDLREDKIRLEFEKIELGDAEAFISSDETVEISDKLPLHVLEAIKNLQVALVKMVHDRNKPGGYRYNLSKCSECIGHCCLKYDPIILDQEDVDRIGRDLGANGTRGLEVITYLEHTGIVAKMKRVPVESHGGELGCFFFDGKGCSIYDSRPKTCREHSEYYCQDFVQISKKPTQVP